MLSRARTELAVAARAHRAADGASSAADALWVVALGAAGPAVAKPVATAASGKGCHVPLALADGALAYHFRSPVEAGDIWVAALGPDGGGGAARATHTMPVALRAKLAPPEELAVARDDGAGAPEDAPWRSHALEKGPAGGERAAAAAAAASARVHALLYRPPAAASGASHPAIVWAHGGPMTAFAYDYNPIASWLASLGRVRAL